MKKFFTVLSIMAVAFMNAQVDSLDEDFQSFPITGSSPYGGGVGPFAHNDWKADKPYPYAYISQESGDGGNKYVTAYSLFSANVPIHFFTPELNSTVGKLLFEGVISGMGTLEIGVVTDTNDLSTYVPVQTVPITSTPEIFEVNIATEGKYIVFKYTPGGQHLTFLFDNVVFTPQQVMATNEVETKSELLLAVDNPNQRIVFTDNTVSKVKVYNTIGNLVLDTKVDNNFVSIFNLNSGVYIVVAETKSGEVKQTKFIKK